MILTATVSEIFGGQTNSSILVVGLIDVIVFPIGVTFTCRLTCSFLILSVFVSPISTHTTRSD